MKIRNFILPVLIVVAIGGYIVYKQFSSNPSNQPSTLNNGTTSAPSESINPGSSNPPPAQQPPATQTGYKDGQYAGDTANTVYGDVQVKAVVSGGKLTDIQFLTYPSHMGHSMEVSNYSLPILKSEAMQAQNAQVNVVSGATQTSEGFSQSLASALSKAV
jgi:uncharacterized protein with FMN-binding domain